ncbi:2TM domain-containing protein [uncultured Tenacibaculum sp.]|uniref:2TM domain-containing protein n=1 Tax=uncultured Tenacibaculum sp. TaxID=174713 RepID=UPI00262ECB42|nr:2TM domain-containing protein [uncultured Tenacibaculum sp.]
MVLDAKKNKYLLAKKEAAKIKSFYDHLTVYLVFNIIFALSSNVSEINFHIFGGFKISNLWYNFENFKVYPLWAVWGIIVIFQAIDVYAISILLGKNWEKRKIKELIEKDKKQANKYID